MMMYEKWLISMSDRAWRQTRSADSTTGEREIYPVNSTSGEPNAQLKLPGITKAF